MDKHNRKLFDRSQKLFVFLSTTVAIDDLVALLKKLVTANPVERIIEVAGASPISYQRLFELAVQKNLYIREIPEALVRNLVRYLIGPCFPSLVNFEQYQLLFFDNTSSSKVAEKLLGRKLADTEKFWMEQLS